MNIVNAIRSAIAGIFLSISLVFQPQVPLPTPTPIPTITVTPTPSSTPTPIPTSKPPVLESCGKAEQRGLDLYGNLRGMDEYLIANRIDCHYALLQRANFPKSKSNIQDLFNTRNAQNQNSTQNNNNNSGSSQYYIVPVYTAPGTIPSDNTDSYVPPVQTDCSVVNSTLSSIRQSGQSSIDSARSNAISECGRRGLATDSEGCQAYISSAIAGPTSSLNLSISQYCVGAPLSCPCP